MPYTFPTLSQNPSVEGWDEGVAKDPTISTDFENGFRQTYPAFSRIPDKWKISYKALPAADKNTLRTFEKTVKVGSESFSWTNPVDNVTYAVRFLKPLAYSMHSLSTLWNIEFELEQV